MKMCSDGMLELGKFEVGDSVRFVDMLTQVMHMHMPRALTGEVVLVRASIQGSYNPSQMIGVCWGLSHRVEYVRADKLTRKDVSDDQDNM